MKTSFTDMVLLVPLDEETHERLKRLSDFCRADKIAVAASLLHDILKDDEEANIPAAAAAGTPTYN
jgi:hypothetical protein